MVPNISHRFLACGMFPRLADEPVGRQRSGAERDGALLLLVLIQERTVAISLMLGVLAHSARQYSFFHGDVKALTYSYLLYGGAVVTVIIGVSFRFIFMKNPDFDPTYRRPDRENTWLGVVVVLGLVFGLGFVGIYLAWR
jgi:hypothetical protein